MNCERLYAYVCVCIYIYIYIYTHNTTALYYLVPHFRLQVKRTFFSNKYLLMSINLLRLFAINVAKILVCWIIKDTAAYRSAD